MKGAWHLARVDANSGFIKDTYNYDDFAFHLDREIDLLCSRLKDGTYHPHGLLRIDVPKDTLSVRPGSLIEIRDLTVLFGIILLIAEKLDSKLIDTVFSYRFNPSKKRKTLFKDNQLIHYTFLKKRTIKIKIDIFEPWYEQWPIFMKKSVYAFEKEGYKYLSLSDIAAYFENIDLDILRELLLKYFPTNQKIINLLVNILEHWTWPTRQLTTVRRGIPQGNSISSFLGNIYLIPLDEAFKSMTKNSKIKYFRYMDDIKIFSKTKQTAIKSLFLMNDTLRQLHLNIQGAKTVIKHGNEVKDELIDEVFEEVNNLVLELQKGKLKKHRRAEIHKKLNEEEGKLNKEKILKGKEIKLYRRILTGFILLHENDLVKSLLKQIQINPDERLTTKTVNYFKLFPEDSQISVGILSYLNSPTNLFAFQEASLLRVLRYSHKNISKIQEYARKVFMRKKNNHWYVRAQAVNILSNRPIKLNSFKSIMNLYNSEVQPEVKKAIIKFLCQLDFNEQLTALNDALYDPYHKISNLSKMLLVLRTDRDRALQELKFIFNECFENKLIDNFYKIGAIRFNQHKDVGDRLRFELKKHYSLIKNNKYLKLKFGAIIKHKQLKLI